MDLAAPILREIVNAVKYNSKVRCLVQEGLEMFDSLLFCQVQTELFLDLFMNITMFDVGNVRIHHKGHQIEDQVGTLSEDGESCEAEVLEAGIMRR